MLYSRALHFAPFQGAPFSHFSSALHPKSFNALFFAPFHSPPFCTLLLVPKALLIALSNYCIVTKPAFNSKPAFNTYSHPKMWETNTANVVWNWQIALMCVSICFYSVMKNTNVTVSIIGCCLANRMSSCSLLREEECAPRAINYYQWDWEIYV